MTDDATRPLDDREIRELDELLAALPEKHSALDVAALDGYIAGVLLQPESVPAEAWLPLAFDADGGAVAWPDAAAGQRATDLLMRRYFEMAASIAGREPFDPIVFDLEDDAGAPLAGTAAIVALEPWAAGFATAFEAFPGLLRRVEGDAELAERVAGILRHLPLPSEADVAERADYAREQADLQAEVPLADLDAAIDDLVGCVLDIADVTRPNRPVARATPKVGRNDPCPCGSGRKYKHCHGRAAA